MVHYFIASCLRKHRIYIVVALSVVYFPNYKPSTGHIMMFEESPPSYTEAIKIHQRKSTPAQHGGPLGKNQLPHQAVFPSTSHGCWSCPVSRRIDSGDSKGCSFTPELDASREVDKSDHVLNYPSSIQGDGTDFQSRDHLRIAKHCPYVYENHICSTASFERSPVCRASQRSTSIPLCSRSLSSVGRKVMNGDSSPFLHSNENFCAKQLNCCNWNPPLIGSLPHDFLRLDVLPNQLHSIAHSTCVNRKCPSSINR